MTEPLFSLSLAIRRLHFAVATLVTMQLVIGLVMSPRHTPTLFLSHQIIGLLIAGLVLLHWAWLGARDRRQLANLFPYSSAARREIRREAAAFFCGRLPTSGNRPGLTGLVHGLGLLALTAVAALGVGIFVLIRAGELRSTTGEILNDLHVFFAWVLIVYWGGHVSLAIAHEALGDHVILRMATLSRNDRDLRSQIDSARD